MVTQKNIPTDEELAAMNDEERQMFTDDYYQGAFAHAGFKPTFNQKIKRILGGLYGIIISLVSIAIVYVIINLVLVGGQELYHGKDKSELKEIKLQLNDKENKIKYYEMLNDKGTISDEEWNTYTQEIDSYNVLVENYNKLSEKVGSTWYVIPVPGGKH